MTSNAPSSSWQSNKMFVIHPSLQTLNPDPPTQHQDVNMDKTLPAPPSPSSFTLKQVGQKAPLSLADRSRLELELMNGRQNTRSTSRATFPFNHSAVGGIGVGASGEHQVGGKRRSSLAADTFISPMPPPGMDSHNQQQFSHFAGAQNKLHKRPRPMTEYMGLEASFNQTRDREISWEVLTDARASMDMDTSDDVGRGSDFDGGHGGRGTGTGSLEGMEISERVRTWKSATNGVRPSGAGGDRDRDRDRGFENTRTSGDFGENFAIATVTRKGSKSLKYLASTISLRRSVRKGTSLHPSGIVGNGVKNSVQAFDREEKESSPAPTVCVAKRHTSSHTYSGPSTIRLVSASTDLMTNTTKSNHAQPQSRAQEGLGMDAAAESPDYKTLKPIKPFARYPLSREPEDQTVDIPGLADISSVPSSATIMPNDDFSIASRLEEIPSMYPTLYNRGSGEGSSSQQIPGSFPFDHPTKDQPTFEFGSPLHAVSNQQFANANAAVLEEMNARLVNKGVLGIGQEPNIVSMVEDESRPNVYGPHHQAGNRPGSRIGSRFDAIHSKQFAKMDGIDTHYAAKRTGRSQGLKRQASNDAETVMAKRMRVQDGGVSVMKQKSILELRKAGSKLRRGGVATTLAGRVDSPAKRSKKSQSTGLGSTRGKTTTAARSASAVSGPAGSGSRALGFLSTSASTIKNTFSAIGRRLSIGPDTFLRVDTGIEQETLGRPKNRSRGSMENLRSLLSRSRSEADIRAEVVDGMEKMVVPRATGVTDTQHESLRKRSKLQHHASFHVAPPQPEGKKFGSVVSGNVDQPKGSLESSRLKSRPVSSASYSSSARISAINMNTGLPAPASNQASKEVVAAQQPFDRSNRKSSRPAAPAPRGFTSSLYAPTASSLARMQATIKPTTTLRSNPGTTRIMSGASKISTASHAATSSVKQNSTAPLGESTAPKNTINPNPFAFPAPSSSFPYLGRSTSTTTTSLPAVHPIVSRPLPSIPRKAATPAASIANPHPIASAFMAPKPAAGIATSTLTPNSRRIKYAPRTTPSRLRHGVGPLANSPARALKHKTSSATLAMSAKQQEIMDRRRMYQQQRMMNDIL